MNNDEFYTYEDRAYIKPTLSSGEQEKFIDNLRDIQKQNTAQIAEQTYNLGTQVPSNLGGLGGGESYFTSRYQTPQVDEMVSTLKAASQAQELQDTMSNYQAQLKNKYSQAQRAYNKRERARQRALQNAALKSAGGNTPKNPLGYTDSGLDVDERGITNMGPGTTTYTQNGRKYVQENGKTYEIYSDGTLHDTSDDKRGSKGIDRVIEDVLGGVFDFAQGLFGFGK